VDEAKRALHDAICAVRNLVVDNKVVYGGGAADISCSIAVAKAADEVDKYNVRHGFLTDLDLDPLKEQYAMRSFAAALDAVPLALAENSGLSPIETVKSGQVTENNSRLGIDCAGQNENGTDQSDFACTLMSHSYTQI
jgi:T-complex protein 1 subunit epsilon